MKTIIASMTVILGLICTLALACAYETIGFGKMILFGIIIGLVECIILAYCRD